MKISVILGHPDTGSFNHAIAQCVVDELKNNAHTVYFHDLYNESFDPLLPSKEIAQDVDLSPDIARHCTEIAEVDSIIIIHPNWWGQPPAILKGWVDRVIRPGVAYMFLETDGGEGVPVGLLKARSAIVFNTSNTETQRELNVFGDPLDTIWKNCVFGLCGVSSFYRRTFNIVVTSDVALRKKWLAEVRQTIQEYY